MNRAPNQLSLFSLLCLSAYSLLAACSSSDSPSNTSSAGATGSGAGAPAAGSSSAGSPNGGQANAAGAAGQSQVGGAGVGTGGMSAAAGAAQGGAGAGGTGNHAGAGGASGATNTAGTTGDPGRPMGVVTACTGPGCPFGECDQAACTSLYPQPLSADSMLCASNATGQYCLVAGKAWAVVCSAGTASVSKCSFACDFDKVKLTATCP